MTPVEAQIKVLALAAKVLHANGEPDLADRCCEVQARIAVDHVVTTAADRTAPGNRLTNLGTGS